MLLYPTDLYHRAKHRQRSIQPEEASNQMQAVITDNIIQYCVAHKLNLLTFLEI